MPKKYPLEYVALQNLDTDGVMVEIKRVGREGRSYLVGEMSDYAFDALDAAIRSLGKPVIYMGGTLTVAWYFRDRPFPLGAKV